MTLSFTSAASRVIPVINIPFPHWNTYINEAMQLGIIYFQVGYKLIHTFGGIKATEIINQYGGTPIYDGRLHAKAETIGEVVQAISDSGACATTIHTSISQQALTLAVQNAGTMSLIGVTASSDLITDEFRSVFGQPPCSRIPNLVNRALESGIKTIAFSPYHFQIGSMRRIACTIIGGGICPTWSPACNETTMTPHDAVILGASAVVINRPLYHGNFDLGLTLEKLQMIISEVESALQDVGPPK